MDQYTRRIIGFWDSCRNRRWYGTVSNVQSSDSKTGRSEILEFGSRSFISIPSVASQPPKFRTEIKTVPYVPMSHPFVERLIGTIRREYLDRTLFWRAIDLGVEVIGVQGLQQSPSSSRVIGWRNTRREF